VVFIGFNALLRKRLKNGTPFLSRLILITFDPLIAKVKNNRDVIIYFLPNAAGILISFYSAYLVPPL
jgi:hypothetical protein